MVFGNTWMMSVDGTASRPWWASGVIWTRVASTGLLLVGLGLYGANLTTEQISLPLVPLVVDPTLPVSSVLPIRQGALAGQNLLLVTIDTTRPDRLGFYGNTDIATPNLDRLAARSAVFTHALATAPTTLPSHASILTGRYPHHHGVRTNGLPPLEPDQTTLAEILSEHGYETAAFVSSFILEKQFGLAQGFTRYDDETHDEAAVMGYSERRADRTTDRALEWLRASRERPFFLWVHYYDPHASYAPPEPFEETSANSYDGELAFIDQQVGRLLHGVTASSDQDALVVVTSDHGESFGEHEEQSHGFLVQEATLKIPLIITTTGGLAVPVRIDNLASQVDLMPTVLSLLGLPVPDGIDGVDLTEARKSPRAVVAETHYGETVYGWARLAAIYKGNFKYVDGPNPEFYDLAKDPAEQHNLFAQRGEEAHSLRRQLIEIRGQDADTLRASPMELDRKSIERLESLGYVAPAPWARTGSRAGPDPTRMVATLTEMLLLATGLEHGHEAPAWTRPILIALGKDLPRDEHELLAAYEEFAMAEPDFAPVYSQLEWLYKRSGRMGDAAASRQRFEQLVRPGP